MTEQLSTHTHTTLKTGLDTDPLFQTGNRLEHYQGHVQAARLSSPEESHMQSVYAPSPHYSLYLVQFFTLQELLAM